MFVDLSRTFHELVADVDPSPDGTGGLSSKGLPITWDEIFKRPRVVLLSEAGSGKTEEIRHAAKRLRASGKSAFFMRLEEISRSFELSFEEGTLEDFESWLRSADEGWLLLDSIDESRLRDPSDFERAVKVLGNRLKTAMHRVHIVLTGRISAWRPVADLALCAGHFPAPSSLRENIETEPTANSSQSRSISREVKVSPFLVVALDDLSSDQVRLFAESKGERDVDAFLEEITRADAFSFTARPLDLEDLLGFWTAHSRVGSRVELVRNSIETRLVERDLDRATHSALSPQKIMEGVTLIAAACTLSNTQIIGVPEPESAKSFRGLQIDRVLPDWSTKEILTLLQRPIFDEEIYGAVRFHHRMVREYLTAEWFSLLLKRNTSRRAIEQLFFRNQYGIEVVPPMLRPVLPWLAILDAGIQQKARVIDPTLLLSGGDPSCLHIETRQKILSEAVLRTSNGETYPTDYDLNAIQRFAAPDLYPEIRALMASTSDDNALVFLLRMVWQGRLVDATEDVTAVALNVDRSAGTRVYAIRALRAVNATRALSELRSKFEIESASLSRDIFAALLESAPDTDDVLDWILRCTAKADEYQSFSAESLKESICNYAKKVSATRLLRFAVALNSFLATPLLDVDTHDDISKPHGWLLKPAAIALHRLISNEGTAEFPDHILTLLNKLPLARQDKTIGWSETIDRVKEAVIARPELTFPLFWNAVRKERQREKQQGKSLEDFWPVVAWHTYIQFRPEQFDEALNAIYAAPDVDDKKIALTLSFSLYVRGGRQRKNRTALTKAVRGSPDLEIILRNLMSPPRMSATSLRLRRMNSRFMRDADSRRKKEEKDREAAKAFLRLHCEAIRNPGFKDPRAMSKSQHYLLHQLRADDKNSSGLWCSGNWLALVEEFGLEVATAFRDGAMYFWRRHKPQLKSEGAPANSTPESTIFGLTGLQIEASEDVSAVDRWSDLEADTAFRFAMHELNGFPPWFRSLYERHYSTVLPAVINEVQYDLETSVDPHPSHYVVDDILWSGSWLWNDIAGPLLAILRNTSVRSLQTLESALSIVQGSDISDDQLAELASMKATALGGAAGRPLWFAVWAGVQPVCAIAELKSTLAGLSASTEAADFFTAFLCHLTGGRYERPSRIRGAFRQPACLRTLYLLAHAYIPLSGDIDRSRGGAYTPTARDEARHARENLLQMLRPIRGKESFLALDEISRAHPDLSYRYWVRAIARDRAVQDSDLTAWSEKQVYDFHCAQTRTPANHRELFDLATLRLHDLKDDLENGDSSNAALLANAKDEPEVRKYVGNLLRLTSNGRYSVTQEDELADGRRPDIRWHGVGFDAPVPVEVKLAHKWTGPQLFERLENQLCGDYLRDYHSGCGVYLLLDYLGRWELPTSRGGGTVDFRGLLSALQTRWEELSAGLPHIEEIKIIGVDLSLRSKSGTLKRKRSRSVSNLTPNRSA
ncbi:hypothetical protein DFR24_2242 [Panacagrimonas perspica]|uniref:Uncharacterized protein n=1 Tax=Panacagrimonas perspica TaxID=381431 RepID=A0A4S3JZD2_9GAMM|nr:hypothetical protein [Panacagrimonas perspica]TDU32834.1 hypothetical protein DFR24_2242 [Panacagrimonas perspica]THD00950.1 hypothetical protein B1810_22075 [Panacagrimonas perspica]